MLCTSATGSRQCCLQAHSIFSRIALHSIRAARRRLFPKVRATELDADPSSQRRPSPTTRLPRLPFLDPPPTMTTLIAITYALDNSHVACVCACLDVHLRWAATERAEGITCPKQSALLLVVYAVGLKLFTNIRWDSSLASSNLAEHSYSLLLPFPACGNRAHRLQEQKERTKRPPTNGRYGKSPRAAFIRRRGLFASGIHKLRLHDPRWTARNKCEYRRRTLAIWESTELLTGCRAIANAPPACRN